MWLLALCYRQYNDAFFFKIARGCKWLRAADGCRWLQLRLAASGRWPRTTTSQPLPATCSHLQPPAATCTHLQPLTATCSYLPKQQLAATGSHLPKQPVAAATFCSHLPKLPIRKWLQGKWLQQVAASGCMSKWLQVAASDCFFENQNDARLLALCESLPRMFQGTDALIIHLFSGENQKFGTSR